MIRMSERGTWQSVFWCMVAVGCVMSFAQSPRKVVMFFGDSITAGFGLVKDSAYPVLIQKKIDEQKLPYRVINAGVSGETTAGGLSRVDWMLKARVDVFVLALGGNDVLRGFKPEETEKNIRGILNKVKRMYPSVVLVVVGMQAPPNMGDAYKKKFDAVFGKVAREVNAMYIPFLLERVAGAKALNQSDGIHPNGKGHKVVAETIWEKLKKEL